VRIRTLLWLLGMALNISLGVSKMKRLKAVSRKV
jgi:hypothetical protein